MKQQQDPSPLLVPELLAHILSHCTRRALMSAYSTCSRWSKVVGELTYLGARAEFNSERQNSLNRFKFQLRIGGQRSVTIEIHNMPGMHTQYHDSVLQLIGQHSLRLRRLILLTSSHFDLPPLWHTLRACEIPILEVISVTFVSSYGRITRSHIPFEFLLRRGVLQRLALVGIKPSNNVPTADIAQLALAEIPEAVSADIDVSYSNAWSKRARVVTIRDALGSPSWVITALACFRNPYSEKALRESALVGSRATSRLSRAPPFWRGSIHDGSLAEGRLFAFISSCNSLTALSLPATLWRENPELPDACELRHLRLLHVMIHAKFQRGGSLSDFMLSVASPHGHSRWSGTRLICPSLALVGFQLTQPYNHVESSANPLVSDWKWAAVAFYASTEVYTFLHASVLWKGSLIVSTMAGDLHFDGQTLFPCARFVTEGQEAEYPEAGLWYENFASWLIGTVPYFE